MPGDVRAALFRGWRKARNRLAIPCRASSRVPDGIHVRQTPDGQIRLHFHATGAIGGRTQPARRGGRDDSGGPEHGARGNPPAADLHAVGIDLFNPATDANFYSQVLEGLLRNG